MPRSSSKGRSGNSTDNGPTKSMRCRTRQEYVCDDCGESFKSSVGLSSHQNQLRSCVVHNMSAPMNKKKGGKQEVIFDESKESLRGIRKRKGQEFRQIQQNSRKQKQKKADHGESRQEVCSDTTSGAEEVPQKSSVNYESGEMKTEKETKLESSIDVEEESQEINDGQDLPHENRRRKVNKRKGGTAGRSFPCEHKGVKDAGEKETEVESSMDTQEVSQKTNGEHEETVDLLRQSRQRKENKTNGKKAGRSYPCEHCSEVFGSKLKLRRHMAVHNEESPREAAKWTCDNCDKVFKKEKNFLVHSRAFEVNGSCKPLKGRKQHVCTVCQKTFAAKSHLKVHTMIHSDSKPFSCDVCGSSFRQKGNLLTHMRTHTKEQPYACMTCGRKFRQKAGLDYHVLIHGKNGAPDEAVQVDESVKKDGCYFCHCGIIHTTLEGYKTHVRGHGGVKPYSCDICGRKFRGRYTYREHRRRHDKDYLIWCEVCGKGFYRRKDLKAHRIAKHGDAKSDRFPCQACDKTFTTAGSLHLHRRNVHQSLRAFKCDVCEKTFATGYNLRVHARTHTGVKPYLCRHCGRRFCDPANLIHHNKIHEKNKEENQATVKAEAAEEDVMRNTEVSMEESTENEASAANVTSSETVTSAENVTSAETVTSAENVTSAETVTSAENVTSAETVTSAENVTSAETVAIAEDEITTTDIIITNAAALAEHVSSNVKYILVDSGKSDSSTVREMILVQVS